MLNVSIHLVTYKIEKLYPIGDVQFEITVSEEFNDLLIRFLDSNDELLKLVKMYDTSKTITQPIDLPGKYIIKFEFTKTSASTADIWKEGIGQS